MLNRHPTYLDSAATTRVDGRVIEAMLPYFDQLFGNASSNHIYGKESKLAIDTARDHVAKIINATSKEIIFTSGATEAINWALKGFLEANPEKGNHIITVKTEHKAVLNTCDYLESRGFEVTYLGVDKNGLVSLDELKGAIRGNTALISVMYVNNEIGVIQDIREIGRIARENDICFFCDATQAVGKVPVDIVSDKIDLLCLSGHKFNGPKGIGALYIRSDIRLAPLIHGGGQENGLRGGTYNTPLIVGLGEACRLAYDEFEKRLRHLNSERQKWEAYFEENNLGTVNFKGVNRAPHIISISLKSMEADEFLMLKSKEFVASTGSACTSGLVEESHVLAAVGRKEEVIRVSPTSLYKLITTDGNR